MVPNLPNQSNPVAAGNEATAPFPQEQPPVINQRSAIKDPSGGDKEAGSATQPPAKSEIDQLKAAANAFQQAPEQTSQQATANDSQAGKQATNNDPQAEQAATRDEFVPGYQESAVLPGMVKPLPEEILFEWQSQSRPFKKHNRQFFTSVGIIGLLVALILIFAGQWLPMAVVVAVVFVIYVFNTIPPGVISHQATTYGIRVEDKLYYWEEMGRFWFTEKYGSDLLNIELARFPNRLTLLIGDLNKQDLTDFLSEILLNQQPPPTTYEKIAAWVNRKLPLDLDK